MAIWDSEAACVGYLKIFRAMPRHWKIAEEASYILSPVCMSVVAYLQSGGWSGWFWLLMAVIYWAISAAFILRLFRGRPAERRGIDPDFPRHYAGHTFWRGMSYFWAVLIAFAVFLVLSEVSKGHRWPHDTYLPFLFMGIFLTQLPNYLRSRFQREAERSEPGQSLA